MSDPFRYERVSVPVMSRVMTRREREVMEVALRAAAELLLREWVRADGEGEEVDR